MEETGLNMSVSSPNNTQNNDAEIASESMTRPDNAHSTGVADSGRWSTKRIAMYALFVALSMAVSFVEFPIVPGVEWLKYDPSGIVSLVAGFAYGPAAAVIVSVRAGVIEYVVSQQRDMSGIGCGKSCDDA